MALTKAQRSKIKPANFGLPGTDQYPINTPGRARSALARVAANGTPTEQHTVQNRVAAKYPGVKVNGTGGNTGKPTPTGAGLKNGTGNTPKSTPPKKTTAKRAAPKPMRRGK